MNLGDRLGAPSWVVFQLLEQCNLRCAMCYEWGSAGTYHAKDTLTMLDTEVILRTVEECLPTRPLFEFFGGEPLLHPGIWDAIRCIRKGRCDISFSTNGTLLEMYAEQIVETSPTQLWVSLDGPPDVNDAQRGRGVSQRAMDGIRAVVGERRARRSTLPRLGITYVVTVASAPHIEEFFHDCMDLSALSAVSIELQRYATADQVRTFAADLATEFGAPWPTHAQGYVHDPAEFSAIDFDSTARQIAAVRSLCEQRGVAFFSQPEDHDAGNLRSFFTANWHAMTDRRSRCAVPWLYAEVSARGDVTTCHTFYDLAIGNIYERSLLDIWRGERLKRVQSFLRNGMFSICTACCRYYTGPAPAHQHGV